MVVGLIGEMVEKTLQILALIVCVLCGAAIWAPRAHAVDEDFYRNCDLSLCLRAMTSEQSKMLPQQIDRFTIWQSIGLARKTVVFNYVFIEQPGLDIDLVAVVDEIRPLVERAACSEPIGAILIARGVSYAYRYSDAKGNFLREIEVNSIACAARKKKDVIDNPDGLPGA